LGRSLVAAPAKPSRPLLVGVASERLQVVVAAIVPARITAARAEAAMIA
jgi:hypothetical protein